MSKIEGVAKKFDGTAIDYVSIFNWSDGTCRAQVVPDAAGNWKYYYFGDESVGLTYIADGCEPTTHGSYLLIYDASNELIINGNFDVDLSGWTNRDNHWQWVNGSAYHPFTSQYKTLTQELNTTDLIDVVIDLEIIRGALDLSLYSNKYLYQNNTLPVGRHTVTFTAQSEPNATLYFGRKPGDSLEMYVHGVSVTKAT